MPDPAAALVKLALSFVVILDHVGIKKKKKKKKNSFMKLNYLKLMS